MTSCYSFFTSPFIFSLFQNLDTKVMLRLRLTQKEVNKWRESYITLIFYFKFLIDKSYMFLLRAILLIIFVFFKSYLQS